MTKTIIAALIAFGAIAHAQAQSTSAVATQQSAATSTAQGSIQFSQSPADTTSTVRNVSAPVLGAYASSFSQMNCSSTAQAGMAFAGFSVVVGASKDSASCVLEVAAAELTRQSTVTSDEATRAKLQRAAINVRCQVSAAVYEAMQDAGLECSRKPAEMQSRADTQPASTRIQ
jgi:hypothetical protein